MFQLSGLTCQTSVDPLVANRLRKDKVGHDSEAGRIVQDA
jgi:hypothetical protein